MAEARRWWGPGDLNAFFGLLLDNVTNLVLLSGILVGGFGMPLWIIRDRMIPGTALGVMVGDLAYTWMAIRLGRRTGRSDVTAMPLGLDTPSTIGMAVAVIGPTWVASGSAEVAWQVGAATLVVMGLVKVVLSFCGDWIRRMVPDAGLLGSIGGVGLALLAYMPLVEIFRSPIVGMVSLGLVLYTMVARLPLPGRLPGAFVAIVAGTAIHWGLAGTGLLGGEVKPLSFALAFTPPLPTLAWIEGLPRAVAFLPIAVPFGLLTVVGGINVTQSARLAGDEYRTRDILLVEAGATLVAGLFGGVAQTTPYIGHPAYKAMGGRAGYTLATALFVGLGGALGVVGIAVEALPSAAVVPILLFVGLEIVSQAYRATPREHTPAVTLAFVPVVAYLVLITMDDFAGSFAALATQVAQGSPEVAALLAMPARIAETHQVLRLLGHGFIVTSMLWGAWAAMLIDRRVPAAAAWLGVCALLTLFGVIHSASASGAVYLPWNSGSAEPFRIALGYGATALVLLTLGAISSRREFASS